MQLEVHHCKDNDWEAGEGDVVDLQEVDVVDRLARPSGDPANQDERHRVDDVLVEIVRNHVSVSAVALATVNQEQGSQILELVDRVVCCRHSLATFLTCNTDSDVSLRDHRYIVGSITD